VDPKSDSNNTLILSGTDGAWTVDAGPEPGSGSNILGGVTTIAGRPWAAGIYDDGGSELPLVEHRQTYSWVRASSIWRMRPCAPFASAIARASSISFSASSRRSCPTAM